MIMYLDEYDKQVDLALSRADYFTKLFHKLLGDRVLVYIADRHDDTKDLARYLNAWEVSFRDIYSGCTTEVLLLDRDNYASTCPNRKRCY